MNLCSYEFINYDATPVTRTKIIRLEANLFAVILSEKGAADNFTILRSEQLETYPYSLILKNSNITIDKLNELKTVYGVEEIANQQIAANIMLKEISSTVERIENIISKNNGRQSHLLSEDSEYSEIKDMGNKMFNDIIDSEKKSCHITENTIEVMHDITKPNKNGRSFNKSSFITEHYTPEIITKAKELYDTNKSLTDISKITGIDLHDLIMIIENEDWYIRNAKPSKKRRKIIDDIDLINEAKILYEDTSIALTDIVKILGIGTATFHTLYANNGFKPRGHKSNNHKVDYEKLKEYWNNPNMTINDIIDKLKIHVSTVYSIAKKNNWPKRPQLNGVVKFGKPPISDDIINEIKSLYTTTTLSLNDIAEKIGVSVSTISKYKNMFKWIRPTMNQNTSIPDVHESNNQNNIPNKHMPDNNEKDNIILTDNNMHHDSTEYIGNRDVVQDAVFGNVQIIDKVDDEENYESTNVKRESPLNTSIEKKVGTFIDKHIKPSAESVSSMNFMYDKFLAFASAKKSDIDKQRFIDIAYSYIKYMKRNYTISMTGADENSYTLIGGVYSAKAIENANTEEPQNRKIIRKDISPIEFLNSRLTKNKTMSVNIAFLYKQFTKHSSSLSKLGEFHNTAIKYAEDNGIERVGTILYGVQYNEKDDGNIYDVDDNDGRRAISNSSPPTNKHRSKFRISKDLNPITKQDGDKILELYLTNSIRTIIDMFDGKYTYGQIGWYISNNRTFYKNKKHGKLNVDIDKLAQLYNNNVPIREIANIFNCDYKYIETKLSYLRKRNIISKRGPTNVKIMDKFVSDNF